MSCEFMVTLKAFLSRTHFRFDDQHLGPGSYITTKRVTNPNHSTGPHKAISTKNNITINQLLLLHCQCFLSCLGHVLPPQIFHTP